MGRADVFRCHSIGRARDIAASGGEGQKHEK